MRYILFALVLGVSGCAAMQPAPEESAGVSCFPIGTTMVCGSGRDGAPVGPSSQEHRYDEARH